MGERCDPRCLYTVRGERGHRSPTCVRCDAPNPRWSKARPVCCDAHLPFFAAEYIHPVMPSASIDGKICSRCGRWCPIGELKRDAKNRDGYSSYCRACHGDATKRWQRANPDRAREIQRRARSRPQNRERARQRARDWQRHNAERARWSDIARRYNVTREWWEATLAAQDGRCGICEIPQSETKRRFSVDHDHSCCPGRTSCGRCVRGLLCSSCNLALALFEKRDGWVRRALDYLGRSAHV